MEIQKTACCGLKCDECPVFIATEKNDDELREKTAKEWTKLYADYIDKKELVSEDINCQGCQSETGYHFIECKNCSIRKCCKERNLSTCANCIEYKECEMINGFFSMHQQAKQNLDNIITD